MPEPLVACLDLEGVLVPEIWINVAAKTGIAELRRTTRDEPDYDKLMRGRLAILERERLTLADIQGVIATIRPLEGASEFLDWLRARMQVIILSDTFSEFAQPLMAQLGYPCLFCNSLDVDGAGRWKKFVNITLPLLKPAMIPAVILGVVWTFNLSFNVIYLVSGGAPDGATDILVTQAFRYAFEQYRYGYAAAYATIIFFILMAYTMITNRITKATEGAFE
jgi:hypothetical protein